MICHYWFFNGCRDLTMLNLNIRDITITTNKNVDYSSIIYNISKYKAINLSEKSVP